MILECVFILGLITGLFTGLILFLIFYWDEVKGNKEFDERQERYKKMI